MCRPGRLPSRTRATMATSSLAWTGKVRQLLAPASSAALTRGSRPGGASHRHYAHRTPLAFKALMTIPKPTAFSALIHGHDGECVCRWRPFADAG
jgi:hypothetical protein